VRGSGAPAAAVTQTALAAALLAAATHLLFPATLAAQTAAATRGAMDLPQTQADDYTRYELQAPGSGAFRIHYDVTATTPGKTHYFNTIRAGAEDEVHGVTDLTTGLPLAWEVVGGEEARSSGHPTASPEGRYIRVTLARPVPQGGEVRIRVDKTYRDRASYFTEGNEIVFDRSLSIERNAVVLPPGYELVAVNHPSQVQVEEDGRIKVSFFNTGAAAVPYRVRARPLPAGATPPTSAPQRPPAGFPEAPPASGRAQGAVARVGYSFGERAFQDREIVYFLLDPESHSFRLYHDYTETRPGVGQYLNVVRAGSTVSNPAAFLLDTGERLAVETLTGEEVLRRGIQVGEPVEASTELVVIRFDPPAPGESRRLRIWETYTDSGRYLRVGDELIWDRHFGRPRNAIVLPEGWYLTTSAFPAVVSETQDGRIRLDFNDDEGDGVDAFVKALRRSR
jgi:hypothetical protein